MWRAEDEEGVTAMWRLEGGDPLPGGRTAWADHFVSVSLLGDVTPEQIGAALQAELDTRGRRGVVQVVAYHTRRGRGDTAMVPVRALVAGLPDDVAELARISSCLDEAIIAACARRE